jgi:hypothetical protein
MNWKQFLKPDWRKIFLTVILLILGLIYVGWIESCVPHPCFGGPYSDRGFPLAWLHSNYSFSTSIDWTNFFLDIIFWYLVSYFIVWIYYKTKKREVKKK